MRPMHCGQQIWRHLRPGRPAPIAARRGSWPRMTAQMQKTQKNAAIFLCGNSVGQKVIVNNHGQGLEHAHGGKASAVKRLPDNRDERDALGDATLACA